MQTVRILAPGVPEQFERFVGGLVNIITDRSSWRGSPELMAGTLGDHLDTGPSRRFLPPRPNVRQRLRDLASGGPFFFPAS